MKRRTAPSITGLKEFPISSGLVRCPACSGGHSPPLPLAEGALRCGCCGTGGGLCSPADAANYRADTEAIETWFAGWTLRH